jgi:two-component system sensor histidine kinase BaeS
VLVNDLRTLALADTGSLHLQREPVELAILVHDTFATFADVATAAGARLSARIEPPGLVVDADSVRLGSVLANLVSNALRHVHRGGEVRVGAREVDGGVEVVVGDDGDGITPALLPRVFDRFVKGVDSPGSGLGLAIVRDIVEAHCGTVTITSTLGAGTEVRLTLPAAHDS